MSRIHDLGGLHGLGPVPGSEDQGTFHAAWEARIFGIMRTVIGNGVCNLDEFRHTVERLDPATYLGASYYERWVLAVEKIAVEQGVLEAGAVDRRLAKQAADGGAA